MPSTWPLTSRRPSAFLGTSSRLCPSITGGGTEDMPGRKDKAPPKQAKRPREYNLYVIELDPRVLNCGKFQKANPQRQADKPCVYVGSTTLSPEERFEQHRVGHRANRYERRYRVKLLPDLYRDYQGFKTRDLAEEAEFRFAERLRKQGYAVWYGV